MFTGAYFEGAFRPGLPGGAEVYDPTSATFKTFQSPTFVNFGVFGKSGTYSDVIFGAPEGQNLAVGTYQNATSDPLTTGPFLDPSIDNRVCRGTGTFTIEEFALNPDGSLAHFAASFKDQCGAGLPPVAGEVRFRSSIPFAGASPSRQGMAFPDTQLGSTQSLTIQFTSIGVEPLVLGQSRIVGSNAGEFSVTADSCSSQTIPSDATCSVTVGFGPASEGAKQATLTIPDNTYLGRAVPLTGFGVAPGATTAMYLDGDLGEPVTYGRQLMLTPAFFPSAGGISTYIFIPGGAPPPGRIDLLPPTGERLHVGTYDNTATFPRAGQAGLSVRGSQYYCPDGTGSFSIEDLQLNADGSIARLAASFEYRCNGLGLVAQLFGELRFRSTIPLGAVAVSRQLLDFPASNGSPQTLTITNLGTIPVPISISSIYGQDAADFSITSDSCPTMPLAPAANCSIGLAFAPTHAVAESAYLLVTGGTGRVARAIELRGFAQPPMTAIELINPAICLARSFEFTSLSGCSVPGGLDYTPYAGGLSLLGTSQDLGDGDLTVDAADFASAAAATGAQIHQQGTPQSLTELAAIAFVSGTGPVHFQTTAGTFLNSGSADWICGGSSAVPADTTTPTATAQSGPTATPFPVPSGVDPDCGGPIPPGSSPWFHPDHAVVADLLCTLQTCPQLGQQQLSVTQNGATQSATFYVVGEPERVEVSASTSTLQMNAGTACDIPPEGVPPGASGATVVTARAFDAAGTQITGAWFQFTSSDTSRVAVNSPFWPSVVGAGGSPEAAAVVCAPSQGQPGSAAVTAKLVRVADFVNVDPNADPGQPDSSQLPSASVEVKVVAFVPLPTTAASTATPVSVPSATATPTSTSSRTPTPGGSATGTAVPTATNTPAGAASVATASATPPTSSPTSLSTPRRATGTVQPVTTVLSLSLVPRAHQVKAPNTGIGPRRTTHPPLLFVVIAVITLAIAAPALVFGLARHR